MADKPDEPQGATYQEERVRTPMPPSLRRQFAGTPKAGKRERATKGVPPWRARKFYRS